MLLITKHVFVLHLHVLSYTVYIQNKLVKMIVLIDYSRQNDNSLQNNYSGDNCCRVPPAWNAIAVLPENQLHRPLFQVCSKLSHSQLILYMNIFHQT